MNEKEFEYKKSRLLEKIAFNKRIKCNRVAAKYERILKELENGRKK